MVFGNDSEDYFLRKKENIVRRIIQNVVYLLPFSAFRGVIWHHLDNSVHSILDVGCGKGEVMRAIHAHIQKKVYSVGIDMFFPYIKWCHDAEIYDDVILCDVRYLPFKKRSFDACVCIEVIEHLHKNDGFKLIRDLEEIACKQVLFELPVGPGSGHLWNGNIYKLHKSCWTCNEFGNLGYKVRGMLPNFPKFGYNSFYTLSFMLPFVLLVYYRPECATHIICTRSM